MSDSKIYVFPDQASTNNNNAALWATLANRNADANPLTTAAMMNGGMNGMWNNPFVYLVWLMFANRFFGYGNGEFGHQTAQNIEVQDQLSALRDQMSTNQNTGLLMDAIKGNQTAIGQLAGSLNCDFNTLNSAICDVKSGIDKVAGAIGFSAERVINAINSGDATLSRQLSECCCNVRDAITRQGYENQLAICNQTNQLQTSINTVATGQERGFSNIAYETQRQTCDITKAISDSTAAILAGQKAAEMREMQREIQNLRDERTQYQMSALSQAQTQSLVNQLRPCPIPAYITCNPFGYQGDNYPYYGGNCGC